MIEIFRFTEAYFEIQVGAITEEANALLHSFPHICIAIAGGYLVFDCPPNIAHIKKLLASPEQRFCVASELLETFGLERGL